MDRPAWKIDSNNPGTDLACETAAALASASILFKDVDSAYSEELLTHARQLFEFGDQYRGIYSDSITGAADFYRYLLKFIKIIDPGMCQRGRQGGHTLPQISADQKAPPGSGGVPHYYLPPQFEEAIKAPESLVLQGVLALCEFHYCEFHYCGFSKLLLKFG